jgi:hypothetical protein
MMPPKEGTGKGPRFMARTWTGGKRALPRSSLRPSRHVCI